MPEGPEVRHESATLNRWLCGTTVHSLKFYENLGQNMVVGGANDFPTPTQYTGISVKGKLMALHFDNGRHIIVSLGMSGYFTRGGVGDHVIFAINDHVRYVNVRKFGCAQIVYDYRRTFDTLGPDISTLGPEEFRSIVCGSGEQIANLLTNQKKISGIGNYLRAEAFGCAGIHPTTVANRVSDVGRLYDCIQHHYHKHLNDPNAGFETYGSGRHVVISGRRVYY